MANSIQRISSGANTTNFTAALNKILAERPVALPAASREVPTPLPIAEQLRSTHELSEDERAQMGDVVSPYYARRFDADGRTRIMRIWYA